jgi:hypothetical protein
MEWWLSGFDLTGLVIGALEGTDPAEMLSRRPEDLAAALSHRIPWDRVNAHFWRSAQGVPAVQKMVETAVRSWRTGGSRVHEAKAFVASAILREAGETVLASGYLEENSAAIAYARRSRKRKR